MKTAFGDPFGTTLYNPTGLLDRLQQAEPANPFAVWISLAMPKRRALPEHQRLVQAIESTTGWSDRRLASILGVSHPTISKLRHRSSVRAGSRTGLLPRLLDVHEVVARVSLLAAGDPVATDRALTTPVRGRRGIDYLAEGSRARAYLAAVDVLNPRTETRPEGEFPASAGRATTPLFDEDD
nr:hypothetical protein [Actinomycetota bacterium]